MNWVKAFEFDMGVCHIRILDHYLETIFPEGNIALCVPAHDPRSYLRAYELGYEGDTWVMAMDHDLALTWQAQQAGYPYSRLLRCAAGLESCPTSLITYDEALNYALLLALDKHQVRPWFKELSRI